MPMILPRLQHRVEAISWFSDAPLAVDRATARILTLSDGTRSASEIIGELNRERDLSRDGIGFKWIEYLFAHGLMSLRDGGLDAARGIRLAAEVDRDVSLQSATAIAVDSSSPSLSSSACDGGQGRGRSDGISPVS